MKKVFLFCIISILTLEFTEAKVDREFRATWITTVWGIDWPKTQINPKAAEGARIEAMKKQKAELCEILDSLVSAGMNAAFFQVRGMSDAMYKSSYENWCQYLTGVRGADPGYDPLQYAIEEAHKRGLELHAWLNPYRYSSSDQTYSELENDYAVQHPDWIMRYGDGITILNPGIPEVREKIQAIIREIITNYDIDGIVFDDYFYAYGGTSSNADKKEQDKYKHSNQSIGDWRRENVNKMVKGVYETIQSIKPYVKFGISPFGTWTNDKSVAEKEGLTLPQGVGRTGDMYHEIYCDPIAWLKEGTVDYISPQIYWTSDSAYPFGKLSDWWSQISNKFGRHFYASHSVSNLKGKSLSPQRRGLSHIENDAINKKEQKPQQRVFYASEMGKQINYNRSFDLNDAPGSIFYNTTNTIKTKGFVKYLKNNIFANFALTPYVSWKENYSIETPKNFTRNENKLTWKNSNKTYKTLIYAIPDGYNGKDKYDSKHVLNITYSESYDIEEKYLTNYTFAISSLDRNGQLSAPVLLGFTGNNPSRPTLNYPTNNSTVLLPCIFTWNNNDDLDNWTEYIWELASDVTFNKIVASRNVTINEFNSSTLHNIEDNKEYYWRVKTIKENGSSGWSDIYKLSTRIFGITSPYNGENNISMTPTIKWDKVEGNSQYTVTIAKNNDFNSREIVYEEKTTKNEITIPSETLTQGNTYYVRVTVESGNIKSISPTITFYTEEIEIPIPTIISPTEEEIVDEENVIVKWEKQPANGFRVELSTDKTFPPRGMKVKKVDAYTYEVEYTDMKSGTYYLRMKAETKNGYTEYCEPIKFKVENKTSIIENKIDDALLINNNNILEIYPKTLHNNIKKISMFSINGIEIYTITNFKCLNIESIILDISNLTNGVYLVNIETKKGKKILKFKK